MYSRRSRLLAIGFFVVGLLIGFCPSAPAVGPVAALRNLAVWTDADGCASIASVVQHPARFVALRGSELAAGYIDACHWVRFTLEAPVGEWWLDLLPPFLDDLRLYEPDFANPGQFLERRAGDFLPFAAREVDYRGFVFKLHQPDNQPRVYYLRLSTTSSSILVLRLWHPEQFYVTASREAALLFGSLTVLMTVLLLAINSWFWLRDPLSPWFIAYVGILILNTAGTTGFVFQYLLPESPQAANIWVTVTALATMAIANGFYRRLLDVKRNQTPFYGLYQLGFWLPLLAIPLAVAGYYVVLMPPLLNFMLLMTVVGMVLSFRLWRHHATGAGLMLVGNLISLLGILAIVLHLRGLIDGGLVLLYSMQIASLGTVLALYLALGSRYRAMQEEHRLEQDRAERALLEAQFLRESQREQSELFAMISHEIKTPLTMIDGAVQALQALVVTGPDVDRRHQRIRRAVMRINGLVEKNLEYDRIGQITETREGLRLLDLAQLAAGLVRDYALPATRLVLNASAPCSMQGNMVLLEVMLTNLVDNALKYTPADTRVCVEVARQEGRVILNVRDGGAGVTPELRPQLFDRYVRGKDVGDIPGAGLGLYLVRRIVHWHGGAIEYCDTGGQGALFCVSLPAFSDAPVMEGS